jgi:hypothetical protein
MPAAIYYSGQTIQLSRTPRIWHIDAHMTATINKTRLGRVEVITTPRPDIHVTGEFPIEDSAALRAQLHNWWQYVLRGGVSAIALDSNSRCDTYLTVAANPGALSLTIANGVDVVVGRVYKLFHGPNFQWIRVTQKSGTAPCTISLATGIDHKFGAVLGACVVRDQNFHFIQIRDSKPGCPIIDVNTDQFRTWPQTRFVLRMDFWETVSGTL